MCDARCAHVAAPILYSCEVRAGHFVKRGQIGRFRPLFAYIHAGDRLADEAGQPFMNLLHLNKSTLYVHAPDSSIFISTYIAGRYATVFYDYARPVADARWVWVWEIYRRDARSLVRSLWGNSLSFPPFFIYLFFFLSFFFSFFFLFLLFSLSSPPSSLFLYRSPSSPAPPSSFLPLPRRSRPCIFAFEGLFR